MATSQKGVQANPPSCLRRLVLVLLAGAVIALGSEFVFRLLTGPLGIERALLARQRLFVTEGSGDFRPSPYTVYTRGSEALGRNSLGFRGHEWELEKPPGVWRILCLGSSTTEAGNRKGPGGSYPVLLERGLRELGLEAEVLNAGMAGWTSAEELVSWFLTLQDYAPDLLVIHEAISDVPARLMPGFRPDYTHWRHTWEAPRFGFFFRTLVRYSDLFTWRFAEQPDFDLQALTAHSPTAGTAQLRPETAQPFLRNIRTIGESAESRGAAVLLLTMPVRSAGNNKHEEPFVSGTHEHNQLLRELAAEKDWMLADAELVLESEADLQREFRDIAHLTPRGNEAKARVVLETLRRAWPALDARSK